MAKKAKERTYTEKELQRLEKLTSITEAREEQGYTRVDQTISILKANIFAVVLMIPVFLGFNLWFFMHNGEINGTLTFSNYMLFLVLFFAGIVVHELVHGFTWGLFAPSRFKEIQFGVMWNSLTPYCTCGEPLTKNAYILGGIMPCIVLGIVPAAAGVFLNSYMMMFVGSLLIVGAAGDLMIVWKILRYRTEKKEVLIYDHPTEGGFIVFER